MELLKKKLATLPAEMWGVWHVTRGWPDSPDNRMILIGVHPNEAEAMASAIEHLGSRYYQETGLTQITPWQGYDECEDYSFLSLYDESKEDFTPRVRVSPVTREELIRSLMVTD